MRCDAVREQKHLREAALTVGKQFKCLAPFRAKTTSSRGHRHLWPFIGRLDSATASDHIERSPVPREGYGSGTE
jgi:hypothetical protein